MTRHLATPHGDLELPAFVPDATRGAIRTLDSDDLARCGVRALMVNAVHLAERPGASVVGRLGGLHRWLGFPGVILCDSGGFQVLSIGRGEPGGRRARVSDDGVEFRFTEDAEVQRLTPEKCIARQFELGADVMFTLDHCTFPDDPPELQEKSVERTIAWAARSKEEFERRVARAAASSARPLLFSVVQGGALPELRRACAARLVEIGFDGYGFGGWPIDAAGRLVDAVGEVAALLPREAPKHALGVGMPENLVLAARLGYDLFDCTLPTRDGRHGRLYAFRSGWQRALATGAPFYEFVNAHDPRHLLDAAPIDADCDCPACMRSSRSYLHHLFKSGDTAGQRLATLHNLRFFFRLAAHLAPADASAPPARSTG